MSFPLPSLTFLLPPFYILPPLPPHWGNHFLHIPLKLTPVVNIFISPPSVSSVARPSCFPLWPSQKEVVSTTSNALVHLLIDKHNIEYKCLLSPFLPPRPQSQASWRLRPLQPGAQTYWQVSERPQLRYLAATLSQCTLLSDLNMIDSTTTYCFYFSDFK